MARVGVLAVVVNGKHFNSENTKTNSENAKFNSENAKTNVEIMLGFQNCTWRNDSSFLHNDSFDIIMAKLFCCSFLHLGFE